jgi:hypothetical protein
VLPMKRLLPLVLGVVLLGAACTPAQVELYNQINGTDFPLPPAVDTQDRAAMVTLPETLVTASDCGVERNVIAWYGADGESHGSFVYEDDDGVRWIYVADSFGCGYHWMLTDDPCAFDAIEGIRGTDCVWPTF